MSATEIDLQRALAARGALLEGHFRLSSGRHSDRFVQKFRVLEDPALLEPVARAIAEPFRSLEPTVVVGAAVGGILLAYEVARQLGTKVDLRREGKRRTGVAPRLCSQPRTIGRSSSRTS